MRHLYYTPCPTFGAKQASFSTVVMPAPVSGKELLFFFGGTDWRRTTVQTADRHSYQVERDSWEWEAAVTDEERLHQIQENLL